MSSTEASKSRMRRELRQKRRNISPASRHAAARRAADIATGLPGWHRASHIALYMSADGEIDTAPLRHLAEKMGKSVYLPVIDQSGELWFYQWLAGQTLADNRYGIPEPSAESPHCPIELLDIVFLPLVGWDQSGARLGMGGGYYDRALRAVQGPTRVGLAYDCQRVDEVPVQDWDIPVQFVVTESGIYRCENAASGPAIPG